MEHRPQEKELRPVSFAAHAARGMVREKKTRRRVMLVVVLLALLMVVGGATFLREVMNPNRHLLRFILFWLACGWFTILALLLALLDLLMVRAQNRAAQKALREQTKIA
ncbi:MAG: hypothetical protein M3119_02535 [Verrucomicrobiota bacterium]|nr:hypothetical protein [Verrucomicrobiota bacterium]